MHVGRAQSVPSGARTRAIPERSLRTSAAVLGGGSVSVYVNNTVRVVRERGGGNAGALCAGIVQEGVTHLRGR